MRKLVFLIIICFIGYYAYKHKEEIKLWYDKLLKKKVETITKKTQTKSNMYKFSLAVDKEAAIKTEGINDVNIKLLTIKGNKTLITIDEDVHNLDTKSAVVKFLKNNNRFTLKLLKIYKNKAEFSVSIVTIKEKPKDVEIIKIEKE